MQKEKVDIENQLEQEEEFMVNKLQILLERILTEKNDLENQLAMEVTEKQDLVMALEKEKTNLTQELQKKIKEIKKDKNKIKKQIVMQKEIYGSNSSTPRTEANKIKRSHTSLLNYLLGQDYEAETERRSDSMRRIASELKDSRGSDFSNQQHAEARGNALTPSRMARDINRKSEPTIITPRAERPDERKEEEPLPEAKDIGKVFDHAEERLAVLQRDKEYYEAQNKKTMQKIVALTTQLDKANKDAPRYKKLLEEITSNRLKPSESSMIAQKMGIDSDNNVRKSQMRYAMDSSIDMETDNSSFVSGDSSFSYDRSERSFSTDIKNSLDSSQDKINKQ